MRMVLDPREPVRRPRDIDDKLCLWAAVALNAPKNTLAARDMRDALINDLGLAVDELRRLRALVGEAGQSK